MWRAVRPGAVGGEGHVRAVGGVGLGGHEGHALGAQLRTKGMALVPLELYFDEHNRVKLCVGIGRGKKLFDKRRDMARRDSDREIQRALKLRGR